jgi:hypothetical protein
MIGKSPQILPTVLSHVRGDGDARLRRTHGLEASKATHSTAEEAVQKRPCM